MYKTSKATVCSLSVELLGTAFLVLSTFAVTAEDPHILLYILLAVLGFSDWLVAYPIYKRILAKETSRINLLIEKI
ncbi:MAG: hypothetical protein LUE12_02470 [Ruminococcus sp.]|nr:hypothetical protein [Ruminococcus sp.]